MEIAKLTKLKLRQINTNFIDLKNNHVIIKNGKKIIMNWAWPFFRTLLFISLGFVIVYPLITMTTMAVRDLDQCYDPQVIWIPKTISLQNFAYALKYTQYLDALKNSLLISVVSTLLTIVSCSLTGYGLARFKFKGRGLLFGLVIMTIILPPQLTIIPVYVKFRFFDFFGIGTLIGKITGQPVTVNLIDTYWAMYIPAAFGVGLRSGLFIYLFRQFFRGMPKELEDAAYLDGCGPFSTYVRIMMPCAGSIIITVLLLSFVWYYNDIVNSSVFLSAHQTLPVAIKSLDFLGAKISSGIMDRSDIALSDPMQVSLIKQSACLMFIIPPLIIYVIFQRYFIEGVERSGIVG